jgi:hypothetical protein
MLRLRSLFSHNGSVVNYQFPKKRIALGPRSNSEYHPVIAARRDTTEKSILNVDYWPLAEHLKFLKQDTQTAASGKSYRSLEVATPDPDLPLR